MHSTPVAMARPKLRTARPWPRRRPPWSGSRPAAGSSGWAVAERGSFDLAERHAVELDLEVDVAQPVVAVDLGRAGCRPPAWPRAQRHRPTGRAPGTGIALEQPRSVPRAVGRRTTMGTWRCAEVHLGQALVVVAAGGDAQRVGDGGEVTPRSAARAKSGARSARAHQAGGGGDGADAGDACAARARPPPRARPARPSSPASTSTYFSLDAPRPTLTRARRAPASALAQLRLDLLLAEAAALVARRHVDGQRGLCAPHQRLPGAKGSEPAAPPPMACRPASRAGSSAQLARLFGARHRSAEGAPGGSVTVTWVC